MRLRINGSKIISETIDDEVVAIDLTTGTYYSLRGSGAEIWEGIERGLDTSEIVAKLAQRYEGDFQEIVRTTSGLIDVLTREELVEAVAGGQNLSGAAMPSSKGSVPFEAPVFEKFEDMQDLILMDPVHEVSAESGWPHRSETDG